MLDLSKIRAIGLDLDDTLWPIWPVIERADARMQQWLAPHAPAATRIFADSQARLALREEVLRARPELGHDMSAVRRECIRLALERAREAAGDPPPIALVLPEHVARRDAPVRSHDLGSYDRKPEPDPQPEGDPPETGDE